MDETRDRSGDRSRSKVFAGLMAMTFAATLAMIVANRLSDESLAVLAGAMCGVGAAIPTSLLVVLVSRQRDERREREWERERERERVQTTRPQGVYPPVVVVAPPAGQQRAGDWNMLASPLTTPAQRQFTVVGGTSVDAEVSYERYS